MFKQARLVYALVVPGLGMSSGMTTHLSRHDHWLFIYTRRAARGSVRVPISRQGSSGGINGWLVQREWLRHFPANAVEPDSPLTPWRGGWLMGNKDLLIHFVGALVWVHTAAHSTGALAVQWPAQKVACSSLEFDEWIAPMTRSRYFFLFYFLVHQHN